MSGHGHVIPNPDGSKARCGGPAMCRVCALEQAAQRAKGRPRVPADIAAAARACKSIGVSDPSLMTMFDLTANELAWVLAQTPIEVVEIEAPARPGSPIDRDRLAELLEQDLPTPEIAKRLGRDAGEVRAAIKSLERDLGA